VFLLHLHKNVKLLIVFTRFQIPFEVTVSLSMLSWHVFIPVEYTVVVVVVNCQPLMDNLESHTYEVFEKDPVKYSEYQKAIFCALRDRVPEAEVITRETYVISLVISFYLITCYIKKRSERRKTCALAVVRRRNC